MTAKTYSRRELYDLVWSEPMSKLAPQHGLSDQGMAKQCRSANVPLPERGYWARKQAGKPVVKAAFPARAPGESGWITVGPASHYGWGGREHVGELLSQEPVLQTYSEDLGEMEALVRAKLGKPPSARRPSLFHHALQRLLDKDELRQAKFAETGYSWEAPLFESAFERRRMRILNAVLLALGRAGCTSDVDKEARRLAAHVGDQRVSFTLDDSKAPRLPEHERPRGRAPTPSGLLKFNIANGWDREVSRFTLQDEVGAPLEDRVTEMAVALIMAGERQLREAARRAYDWQVERRAQLAEEERKRRAEAEKRDREAREAEERARLDDLLSSAQAWRLAQDMRAYVAAVQASRVACDQLGPGWCAWALGQADQMDPLTRTS